MHSNSDISTPNEQRKQRKNDDTDDAHKRPTLNQTRARQSQTGRSKDITDKLHAIATKVEKGDGVFLGPKQSFAAASAARHNKDERSVSVSEDLAAKVERMGRERPPYRGDGDRWTTRHNRENSHLALNTRRDSDDEGDQPRSKLRYRQGEAGAEDDLPTPRRTVFPEKLNKPWFRGGDASPLDQGVEGKQLRSPLHDGRMREARHEQKPSWMDDPVAMDHEPQAQNQQDFAAWKAMMKQGHAGKDSVSAQPAKQENGLESTDRAGSQPATPGANLPIFGLWGQSEHEEKKTDDLAKTAKPVKKSRFFGGGAQKPSEQITPESPKPVADLQPPEDDENKRGFMNIMQMLRAGGTNSQPQPEPGFPPPGLPIPNHQKEPTPPSHSPLKPTDQPGRSPHDSNFPQSPPPQPSQEQIPANHQSAPLNRDTEFLLNLVKQHQQQRPPFQEGQIYGPSYNPRHQPTDIASIINGVGPQRGKPPPPPPGFYENQRAFAANHNLDGYRNDPHDNSPDDRFQTNHTRPDDMHRGAPLPDFRFPSHPPTGLGPSPPGPQHRPPSREGIQPPPGFPAQRPPNAPPGFPPLGPSPHGPPPNTHMQGPFPPHLNLGQPPPGFNGPPPGLGPQPQLNGRRMPSQNIPPGFEMYGDAFQRQRGPPPPPPNTFASQYQKQGAGPAGYGGM